MIEHPILYSFRRCPYAMRARMALMISGTSVEIREVSLRNKPLEMIQVSSKATVPVLVLPDTGMIDESLDVMLWALNRHDPENWLGGNDANLIAKNDGPFKHHLDRYKYPDRHASDPIVHRSAGLAILQECEARLTDKANLCRNSRSLADIAIQPFVRQFAATDWIWFNLQPLPRLQNWLAMHIASPLFQQAMARFPPWKPSDAPTFNTGLKISEAADC